MGLEPIKGAAVLLVHDESALITAVLVIYCAHFGKPTVMFACMLRVPVAAKPHRGPH